MTETKEIEGEFFLKKNTIEFIQKFDFTLADTNTKKLKKLDQDLFQAEILKLEKQNKLQKYFGSIDYRDIIDIKYLCLSSINESNESTEEEPHHDFHLQVSLRAVNGVSLKTDTGSISEVNEVEANP